METLYDRRAPLVASAADFKKMIGYRDKQRVCIAGSRAYRTEMDKSCIRMRHSCSFLSLKLCGVSLCVYHVHIQFT